MKRNKLVLIAVATLIGLGLTAGSCDSNSNKANKANKKDRDISADQLLKYQTVQPVPQFDYSQLRQNLIEVESAQAKGTQTTSFMFLQAGSGATGPLVHWCPSIGFPIPSTYQLTNPQAKVPDADLSIPQLESNGVYTGDSTATFVMCVGADGKPFAFYHEGFVSTVSGPAHWDVARGEIVMDGPSSFEFTKAKK